jgi:hypothetical protein
MKNQSDTRSRSERTTLERGKHLNLVLNKQGQTWKHPHTFEKVKIKQCHLKFIFTSKRVVTHISLRTLQQGFFGAE